MGKAYEYIKNRFGMSTRTVINPLTNAVATSVTKIAQNNADRLALTIVNVGANDVYIGFDAETSASRGIFVGANGGSLTLTVEEDFELITNNVYAISVGVASTIYVVEVEGE